MGEFEQKTVVVTGGGRGIGREVALAFAQEGANVVVVDPGVDRGGRGTDASVAQQVADEIQQQGGHALAQTGSVADFGQAGAMIEETLRTFGHLDVLINCAGVLRERMVWNLSDDDWNTVIGVHLNGTFNMTHHAAVHMREQQYGRIINFASDAWRGSVGQSNYGAAKGGIVSFTYATARELGKYGVTVNAVCPAAATRMTLDEGVKQGMRKRLEAGLITQEQYEHLTDIPGPEFVPPIVLYLATDAAADINGQVFHAEKGHIGIYAQPEETHILYKTSDEGRFGLDELKQLVPQMLLTGYVNPAPRREA